MKKVFTILALLCMGMKGFSQKDSIRLKKKQRYNCYAPGQRFRFLLR